MRGGVIVYDHKLLDNRGLLSVQGGLKVLYLEIDIVSCELKKYSQPSISKER